MYGIYLIISSSAINPPKSKSLQENSLYSSLFKGLHSVLPGKEEEESGDAQTGGTSDKKAELKAEEEQGKPLFETDQHRINGI
jgi:hypothetical protein